ncbi:MAG: NAD(+) synthase [Actinomycetaceae bacterium]|nr:NAD(+) synthase [Actinomycetaceae bacterium]
MNFHSLYDQGFARVCSATLEVALANPVENARRIIATTRQASEDGAALIVFPELSITGYSIDDLFTQDVLYDAVDEAIALIRDASVDLLPVILVGAPIRTNTQTFNCAVAIHRGTILAVKAKRCIPNYREFYEARWFASTNGWADVEEISLAGEQVQLSRDLVLRATDVNNLSISIDICEDLWVPTPMSANTCASGVTVVANLSASPVTVGRARDRHLMCQSASARQHCAYVYSAAGEGESTTDLAWDGHSLIYENGDLLAENERFRPGTQLTYADIDLDRLTHEQRQMTTFAQAAEQNAVFGQVVDFELNPPRTDRGLRRTVDRFPFVPADDSMLDQDCYEAYNIQVSGLVQRLKAIGNPHPVIGISGGLDSTQALLVCAKAMDVLGRPRSDILAFTMPGFATSDHTKKNAVDLCTSIGTTFEELDIRPAATQMLTDMGHPFGRGEEVYDVTFENVQAGLRTDFLFRIANARRGIVIGTGDLSELALGWCTYGVGDHMSHYSVNPGIPKTLMQHLIRWVIATDHFGHDVNGTLQSILDTEISPELIPSRDGEKPQSTQASIGPYALQDFNLFYTLRYGYRPEKIAFLAHHAWSDRERGQWPAHVSEEDRVEYSLDEIIRWLRLFIKRFFMSQFKRSALPNGPKVVAGGSLSPRGDWRMPSDASSAMWLARVDALADSLGIELT